MKMRPCRGTALLPPDLTEDQVAAAPVLSSVDRLLTWSANGRRVWLLVAQLRVVESALVGSEEHRQEAEQKR